MILANPQDEIKSEVLSVKISLSQKKEFASEAADMQIDNSEYLRMLIDSRHETIKLATLIGFVIKTPPEMQKAITALAEYWGISESNFIQRVILDYIERHDGTFGHLLPPISTDYVNASQNGDIQAVTSVNESVNTSVNTRKRLETAENRGSVNGTKTVDESILPIMVTLKIPQLLRNVKSLINYTINEKRTFSKFNETELESIAFYGFEDNEIYYLDEIGRISSNNS